MAKYFTFIALALLFFSCQRNEKWSYNDFFEQAFSTIKEKSIKKSETDWNELRRLVVDSVKQFHTNRDVYRAIGYTIKLIDDGHSVFVDAQTPNNLTSDSLPIPKIDAKIIEREIGYIKLTGFVANIQRSKLYAIKIRESLYRLDSASNISGWIIDLRNNIGGLRSMMPMGLAPLFQDSLTGFNVNNRGDYLTEYCTNRYFYLGDAIVDSMDIDLNLKNNGKKIAVLTSSQTISAGEHLASALRFQPSTKLFGMPTKGKTSGLELITFKGDAKLLLATLYLCDKNKQVVYNSLIPDIECDPNEAYELAVDWIKESI